MGDRNLSTSNVLFKTPKYVTIQLFFFSFFFFLPSHQPYRLHVSLITASTKYDRYMCGTSQLYGTPCIKIGCVCVCVGERGHSHLISCRDTTCMLFKTIFLVVWVKFGYIHIICKVTRSRTNRVAIPRPCCHQKLFLLFTFTRGGNADHGTIFGFTLSHNCSHHEVMSKLSYEVQLNLARVSQWPRTKLIPLEGKIVAN